MSFTTILSAVGTGLKVFGTIQESRAKADAFEYNAAIQRQQAKLTQESGNIRSAQLERQRERARSEQTALFAKAGVSLSGSPLQVIQDTAAELEFDILINDFNTSIDVLNAESAARMSEFSAAQTRRAGIFSAGTTLLTQLPGFVSSMNKSAVRDTTQVSRSTNGFLVRSGRITTQGSLAASNFGVF